MGGYLNDATVDSTVRMLDEEGCTIQLRDAENFLNPDFRSATKMHVEFDNLSYSVYFSKGIYLHSRTFTGTVS